MLGRLSCVRLTLVVCQVLVILRSSRPLRVSSVGCTEYVAGDSREALGTVAPGQWGNLRGVALTIKVSKATRGRTSNFCVLSG